MPKSFLCNLGMFYGANVPPFQGRYYVHASCFCRDPKEEGKDILLIYTLSKIQKLISNL
jgi:hypothetical protein